MAGLPRQMLSPKMFRSPDSSIPLLHSPWSLTIPFRTFFFISFVCVLSICSSSFLGSGHLGVTVHRDCVQVLRQQKWPVSSAQVLQFHKQSN